MKNVFGKLSLLALACSMLLFAACTSDEKAAEKGADWEKAQIAKRLEFVASTNGTLKIGEVTANGKDGTVTEKDMVGTLKVKDAEGQVQMKITYSAGTAVSYNANLDPAPGVQDLADKIVYTDVKYIYEMPSPYKPGEMITSTATAAEYVFDKVRGDGQALNEIIRKGEISFKELATFGSMHIGKVTMKDLRSVSPVPSLTGGEKMSELVCTLASGFNEDLSMTKMGAGSWEKLDYQMDGKSVFLADKFSMKSFNFPELYEVLVALNANPDTPPAITSMTLDGMVMQGVRINLESQNMGAITMKELAFSVALDKGKTDTTIAVDALTLPKELDPLISMFVLQGTPLAAIHDKPFSFSFGMDVAFAEKNGKSVMDLKKLLLSEENLGSLFMSMLAEGAAGDVNQFGVFEDFENGSFSKVTLKIEDKGLGDAASRIVAAQMGGGGDLAAAGKGMRQAMAGGVTAQCAQYQGARAEACNGFAKLLTEAGAFEVTIEAKEPLSMQKASSLPNAMDDGSLTITSSYKK